MSLESSSIVANLGYLLIGLVFGAVIVGVPLYVRLRACRKAASELLAEAEIRAAGGDLVAAKASLVARRLQKGDDAHL